MANREFFYFYAPTWDYPSEGPIKLGNVISSVKKPHIPLINSSPTGETGVFRTEKNKVQYTTEKLRSGKFSVLTKFLSVLGVGVNIGAEVERRLVLIYVTESPNQGNVDEGFYRALMNVASEINRLNKISNTIRRASKDAQTQKANSFQIEDDEGNDVEDFLRQQFKHHICDRFPTLGEVLQERLARTMLLRRKRILYRRHRQGNAKVKPQKTEAARAVELPNAHAVVPLDESEMKVEAPKKSVITISSQVKSATTLEPEKFMKVVASPSIVSASKTVALGSHETLVFPPTPGFALQKRFEQLKKQKDFTNQWTGLPLEGSRAQELIDLAEIICPYCLSALPAKEVFNDENWQNHVINDLDAYVCLFEDCDQPDALYSHSDEWLSHLQQHSRFWRCNSHRELDPFTSSAEYITHMRSIHSSKLNDNQLRIMANRNSRKMPKLFPSCPLCGKNEDEVGGNLEDHLAGHLRFLTLKSLPSYEDETPEDTENDNDSIDISRPQSLSTVREMRQANGALLMATLRSGAFWDLWNPDVPQHAGVNFSGDPHTELENASVFFNAYSFKSNINNPDTDPILQSILSNRQASARFQKMMTHEFEEGDKQVSGSGAVLGMDNTSIGNNHKSQVLQKGKQVRQNPMSDDGEDFPKQRVISSGENGYLIFTVKDLQYWKPNWGVPSSRDGLICEASYGDEVSLLRFQAKGQDRDVHKMFEQGTEGREDYQTIEVSFDISWQLKDLRTTQKTQGTGRSDLNWPSETIRSSTFIRDGLLVPPTGSIWENYEANYGELSPKLSTYYSMERDKLTSDLYSESQGSAQYADTNSIAEMPELLKLPYNGVSIREDNFLIPRKITKQEKEYVIIEREVFGLQRFSFQELYAQKDEEGNNTAEVRKAVELSLREIQEAIQALDDYREVSEDEPNAGRRPTITQVTTAVNNSKQEPPLQGLGESGEPSQRRRHSPSLDAKDEEAQRERLRDRMDSWGNATASKKSGTKSPSSPTRINTGPPRLSEDYQKLSRRRVYQEPTPNVDLRWPVASPSPPLASTQRREKPESDPLPRRKKVDSKREKKEWDSD
ncbi:Phd-finger domain-containing [Fusarium acutatum]|uniref:Phd-finger domain-containing n=1 Tax=Fusarium acutatum TaxID=78861 RepID=A0A8H4JSB1_9HYPO|nr:Phd-finger domain-containing [Fusarium acutatum]